MSRVSTVATRVATVARAGVAAAGGNVAAGAVVLGYHDVVARDAQGLSVTRDALRAHIRLVRRLGLRIVPLEELMRRLTAGADMNGLAVLTFDDGLVGVHRHAVEVLAQEKAPATVFAVSNAWGAEPPWWPGSARTMTREELSEVASAGLSVQAHTRSHRSLIDLDDVELGRELHGCRDDLEGIVAVPVRAVAYPNGLHNSRVRAAARDAGYDVGFTFLNGRLTGVEDPLKLPRFTMTAAHTRARLGYHLARRADDWPDHQVDQVDQVDQVEATGADPATEVS